MQREVAPSQAAPGEATRSERRATEAPAAEVLSGQMGPGLAPALAVEERTATGEQQPAATRRVAIVGVPNTGKSTLARCIAGRFTDIANYPHTTQDITEMAVRLAGERVILIDTPGITGLELCSEDEAATRALLQHDRPEVIIQTIDAGNLTRSLVLTAQLADLEIPMVICLNMVDEALRRGVVVDPDALSRELKIPVAAACPVDGRGTAKLIASLKDARATCQTVYPPAIEQRISSLAGRGSRAAAVQRLLEAPQHMGSPDRDLAGVVLEAHHHWAREVAETVTRRTGLEPERSAADVLAPLVLHPLGAWVFLILTGVVTYLLVAKVGVGLLAGGMERYIVEPTVRAIASWTGPGLLQEILVGPYGLLSLGVLNALCTVLPILGVFYFLFGFLEDIGYFPLLAVQFNRLLGHVGLTGKAVLPISLGFGCNSVATLATRSLDTPRERFIACFILALSIPCSVQLGVMVAILSRSPVWLPLGLIGTIVAIQALAGVVLSRLMPRCERGAFLVELPPLRPPWWRNIIAKTGHRLGEFMIEACPRFVGGAGLLLVLHYSGLLGRIRDLLNPLITRGMGLPAAFTDALMMTLARRELGAVMVKGMADRGQLADRQIFVSLLVMTLFMPCMTNTLLLGKRVGWPKAIGILAAVSTIALGAGVVANWVLA